MNTWEYMQYARANPELFGQVGQDDLGSYNERFQWAPPQKLDPQQLVMQGASAPGRIGALFQHLASGQDINDNRFLSRMYELAGSPTTEERAWLTGPGQNWWQQYQTLKGAGAITDTGSKGMGKVLDTVANKVLLPLTKMVVAGSVGMGAAGALGYGPMAGGTWQGFGGGLAGSEGAGTLAGGGEVLGNAAEAPLGELIMGAEGADTLGNFLSGAAYAPGADVATGALSGGLGMSNLLGKAASVPGQLWNKAVDNPLAALSVLGGTALGLGSASGGGKDITTESMSSVDPRYWQYAEPMLQQGLGMLPGQMAQTNAMQPQLNQTLGGLLNAPNVESNPWVRGWGDALAGDTWKQWEQNAIPSIASAFSMAGRGGGQSGGNMAYSNAVGQSAANTARGLNANLAGLYSGAYGQGLNAAQGGLTQAPSVSQMGWLPLTNYSSLLGSMPWNRTTTTQQPGMQSNPWAGALGGALTGASLWKNLNGGW